MRFADYLKDKNIFPELSAFYSYEGDKYIFGAGQQAMYVMGKLNGCYDGEIKGAVVSKKDQKSQNFSDTYNVDVFELRDGFTDGIILLCVGKPIESEVIQSVREAGFRQVICVDDWEFVNHTIDDVWNRYLSLYSDAVSVQIYEKRKDAYNNVQFWNASVVDDIFEEQFISLSDEEIIKRIYEQEKKGKKIVCWYGNCQFNVIRYYLCQNEWFKKYFFLVDIPKLWEVYRIKQREDMIVSLWGHIDVFLYQNFVDSHQAYGDAWRSENILKRLKSEATAICVCNSYFDGYFRPDIYGTSECEKIYGQSTQNNRTEFIYREDEIAKLVLSGKEKDDVIEMLLRDDAFSTNEVLDHFENSLSSLIRHENKCSVIISDYIQNNYDREVLFFSNNHPTNKLLSVVAYRILDLMGCPKSELKEEPKFIMELDQMRRIVYPGVRKVLGVKKDIEGYAGEYWINKLYFPYPYGMDLKQYMSEYIDYLSRFFRRNKFD